MIPGISQNFDQIPEHYETSTIYYKFVFHVSTTFICLKPKSRFVPANRKFTALLHFICSLTICGEEEE